MPLHGLTCMAHAQAQSQGILSGGNGQAGMSMAQRMDAPVS